MTGDGGGAPGFIQRPRPLPAPAGRAVLLLGATGFIGGHVLQSLMKSGTPVRILTRRPTGTVSESSVQVCPGDLTDPWSLLRAAEGTAAIINAASYVGRDPQQAGLVNHSGTLNVLDAARQLGITRTIQMSTTSVYGSGPHRGLQESEATYAPESVASASRQQADEAVLEAGGVVIRPNLAYGCGDRWFIPGMVRIVNGLGLLRSQTRLSVIDAGSLGQLVARAATSSNGLHGVFHAADPAAVSVEDLLVALNFPVRSGPSLHASDFSAHQIK